MSDDAELDAFMAEGGPLKSGPPCWLCTIPERDLVERAVARGERKAAVLRSLQKRYPETASKHKVAHHFDALHHER